MLKADARHAHHPHVSLRAPPRTNEGSSEVERLTRALPVFWEPGRAWSSPVRTHPQHETRKRQTTTDVIAREEQAEDSRNLLPLRRDGAIALGRREMSNLYRLRFLYKAKFICLFQIYK